MNDEQKVTTPETTPVETTSVPASAVAHDKRKVFVPAATPERRPRSAPADNKKGPGAGGSRGGGGRGGGGRGGAGRGGPRGAERPKPEHDQKMLSVRRVARVVSGGRRFSFSAAVVIGNRKGSVGVGLGKAGDTTLAIEKAVKNAKKNMVKVQLTDKRSIRHEVSAKYGSSEVFIKPAPRRGLSAGGAVRKVLDLAGITDVNGKIFSRSKNPLNNARAAVNALRGLKQ